MRQLIAVVFSFFSIVASYAQVVEDSVSICSVQPSSEQFNFRQLIVPGSLITLGVLGTLNHDLTFSNDIHNWFDDNKSHTHVDDYLRFVPSAAHLSLGFIPGIHAEHCFRDRLLASVTAHASMLAISYGLKYCVNENRPDGSSKHSFPSGHVALAFTGAELTRIEYGTACGLAAYGVSSAVAIMRLYNNRHWFNDILMGAGIGILCARAGYWLLPAERRLFHLDSNSTTAIAVMPAYDFTNRSMQFSVAAVF